MKRNRGFSYLEVLVAVSLVTASALIVAATTPAAQAARGKSAYYAKAIGLAQKELESIRGLGFANLTATQLYAAGLIDSTNVTTQLPTLSSLGSGTALPSLTTNPIYSFTNSDSANNDSPAQDLPSGQGFVILEQVDTNTRRVTVIVSYNERGVPRVFCTGTIVGNL